MYGILSRSKVQSPHRLSSGGRSSRSAGEVEPLESRIGGRRGDRAVPKYSLESLGSSLGRISTPRDREGWDREGWDREGWDREGWDREG